MPTRLRFVHVLACALAVRAFTGDAQYPESRAVAGPGTAWMTRGITAKQWGTAPETIVPRAEYDGLLFVDTTWPPAYVR